MALNDYLQKVQRFLRDARQVIHNPDDLIAYVNEARRMVAYRAECIRVLTPISGPITSYSVTNPGSGYSALPTLTVSAPDFPSGRLPFPSGDQAVAIATVQGGTIAAIFSQYGGDGYFQPTIDITDVSGADATATPVVDGINLVLQNQEVYPLSGINLSQVPGALEAYAVLGITIIYANYRYALPIYDFETYQAMIRNYPFQFTYVPSFASQYQQGASADFYLYPPPSQTYQSEWDCLVVPLDLLTNLSVDIIPRPWIDAVAFYATYLAFLEQQNFNAAEYYRKMFEALMPQFGKAARPWRTVNPYGRY